MNRRAKMEVVLAEYTLEFEKSAANVLHESVPLRCGFNDKLRLLNLKVWSLRYKVSLEFIIKELLAFWLPKFIPAAREFEPFSEDWVKKVNKRRKKGTLGVRLATLAGKRSRQYIAERIDALFQNNENIIAWKAETQMSLSSPNIVTFIASDPMKMARQYTSVLKTSRNDLEYNRNRFSKRPYRDNPWR